MSRADSTDDMIVHDVMLGIDGAAYHDIDAPDVQHILDTLRAKGYEVVKLPEPVPDVNTDYFPAAPGWAIETPDCMPGIIVFDAPGSQLTPANARLVAPSLLAAAKTTDERNADPPHK